MDTITIPKEQYETLQSLVVTEKLKDSVTMEEKLKSIRTIAEHLKKSNDAIKSAAIELLDAVENNKVEYSHCEKMRKALFTI